ncbi:hypothetical protein QBC41DRAFT_237213 [Cercophora samala]|uniref:Uncharacterized protein n=1 Tax=Cercophora samala TaxID=330535 RepID=A0AA39YXP1_9PEZI|nr:hypothetical protein QBC41DRAFT_237213 [Cercophora samala]
MLAVAFSAPSLQNSTLLLNSTSPYNSSVPVYSTVRNWSCDTNRWDATVKDIRKGIDYLNGLQPSLARIGKGRHCDRYNRWKVVEWSQIADAAELLISKCSHETTDIMFVEGRVDFTNNWHVEVGNGDC